MGKNTPIPDFLVATKSIRSQTARMAASEAVKFFKESFVNQGFTDSSLNPWTKSTSPFAGKRSLYKSGNLMRSIKKETETNKKVVVIADSDYAKIHNEGGYITVTEAMKAHFWKRFYELGGGKGRAKKKAMYCRGMALKKVGSKIKIPKRQFMGNSKELLRILESKHKGLVTSEMLKAFKKIKF